MDDERGTEQGSSGADDAARRQAALRALAQSQVQTQAQSHAPVQPRQQPAKAGVERPAASIRKLGGFAALVNGRRPTRDRKWRTLIAFIVVLLIIAVAAGAGVREWLALRTPPLPTVVRIDTNHDGLTCGAQSTAWSPDSALLAVEGGSGCGSSDGNQTNVILLYDARSGKIAQRIHPDALVYGDQAVSSAVAAARTSLGVTGGNTNGMPDNIWYAPITWTPDGRSLLVTFSISIPPPASGAGANVNGLLRLGATATSQSHAWVDKIKYQQNGYAERWDLQTGTSALVSLPKPATAYRWTSDGLLVAADQTAAARIGALDGGQTFSIWQPGVLGYITIQTDPTGTMSADPHRIEWSAYCIPVSPDGRYVYSYFPVFGVLVPPSTGPALPSLASIKPSDRLLGYVVSWRPDGRRMALVAFSQPSATSAQSSANTVTIYDTSTGKVIGHVTPTVQQPGQSQVAGPEILSWSPDGNRLMLSEGSDNAITIWEPGALPK
jgi:WD40 repeat protein